jgi:N-acetylglucosaminyldiphosphoundecaprenol N-acetyl-beta-D-mannosaminyltransferase
VATTTETRRLEILGCRFDPVGLEEVVAHVMEWCRGERRPHRVVTMNVAGLELMRRDESMRQACDSADLVVADGVPLVWASRLLRRPLPSRVAGVDLMQAILTAAAQERRRVYFLGAREEVVQEVVKRCGERCPGLVVAGFRNGYFAPGDHAAIARTIRDARPDLLFVGMPSPFKETWIHQHAAELDVPFMLGVGGSFDVFAGRIRRAPRWIQEIGMEWCWRLAMEPRKLWRRYLVSNTSFLFRLLGALVRPGSHG